MQFPLPSGHIPVSGARIASVLKFFAVVNVVVLAWKINLMSANFTMAGVISPPQAPCTATIPILNSAPDCAVAKTRSTSSAEKHIHAITNLNPPAPRHLPPRTAGDMSKRRADTYLTKDPPRNRPDDDEERERDAIDPVQRASAEVMAARKYDPPSSPRGSWLRHQRGLAVCVWVLMVGLPDHDGVGFRRPTRRVRM
jgi:NUP50 (Nucleoporin 50 kDa)